jgi:serine phosphatase RsbU (regulator of sigma subunit)/SAM-dependent methyltransferase
MGDSNSDYVHGTDPEEQKRLSRLNALLNGNSLGALGLREGERVLDVGSGLGQFTRLLARKVGQRGKVLGIERNDEQLAEALRQARDDGEEDLLDVRRGEADKLPLVDDEWGTFDVAHARFLLEHVTDPLAVVRQMVRAVRPGGRIVLEDDDHMVLRLWPDPPGLLDLWRAYYLSYERQGKDPFVGRHLVNLLHQAGARPRRNRCLDFGSCAGNPNFEAMVENFIGIMDGAREEIVAFGLSDHDRIDAALAAFRDWSHRPDAAMWYTTSWAEGVRPGQTTEERPVSRSESLATPREAPTVAGPGPQDEAALLRFMMDSAAKLSSSLELDKVFHKIATEIRPFIDYHLFCIQLWNEETQILENSFSMKYGQAIEQKGGFPLGYGLCGNAAATRRPIRVANVLEDPRYVRVRHPEVEIHSELAVPLVFQDRLIGVLDLESTEFDYFTEWHEQLVSALAACMATALANARLYEKVLESEGRMEDDLATAREIQRGLLPETTPRFRQLEIGSASTPAQELGGDFYDFLHQKDGRLAFAVGDVAGKATPAALLGSMAVGLLRAHVVEDPRRPAEMLVELNGHLLTAGGDNRFVAMIYGVYDEAGSTLHLANAGFPRPLLLRDDRVEEIPLEGRPLGLFPDSEYQELRVEVLAGDIAVFCSDGVMECESSHGESFESAMLPSLLRKLAARPAQELAQEISAEAERFAGGHDQQRDDYTVLVLKFV